MPPKGKKKKNPLNDFYFFMQDMKKVLRREGQDWETMEDLVALCHPRWRLLPEHDKARYKQRAKDHKEQERLDLQSRFDSQGRTLLQVENEKKSRDLQVSQMLNRIQDTLSNAHEMGRLKQQRFFLLHINTMCEVDNGDFLPCEIALLEFNLVDGIIETFQSFIRPPDKEVPLGYGFKIQTKADESHRLTMDEDPMWDPISSSYETIMGKIMKKINPGGVHEAIAPVYTISEEEEIAHNILENLMSWSGKSLGQDFKVYHVHQLFYYLSQYLPIKESRFSNCHLAEEEISNDVFNYISGLGCKYHDWYDIPRYCSLNCVKRWAYLMMDVCCPGLGIELKNYTHKPIEQKVFKNRQTGFKETMLVNWEPRDETVPQQDEYFNVTTYGAPKTKAAPAGYVPVNPSEITPNEKKLTKKDMKHFKEQQEKEAQAWPDMKPVARALPPATTASVWGNPAPPATSMIAPAWGKPTPPQPLRQPQATTSSAWSNVVQSNSESPKNEEFPDLMASSRGRSKKF